MAEAKPETPVIDEAEIAKPAAVKRPDRDSIKEKEDKLRAEMAVLESKIKVVSDKAKALQQASGGNDDGVSDARSRLKELKNKREKLIAERTSIYGVRDAARESRDAKMSEMKDLKSQTKFKDVGEIDRNIKKLETMQFTTTMSLKKEKEVINEVEDLKKQRRVLAQHMAVASNLDGGKSASIDTGAAIKEINEKLSTIKNQMDKLQTEVNKHYDKKNDSAYPSLIKEKDALRAQKKELGDKVQKLWDDFKEGNKVWKENQAEWDKYRKVIAVKEKEAYEKRKAELKKKRAEELAKKTPYEEEMDLCDYLINYLTTTFLAENKTTNEEESKPVIAEFDGLSLTASKKNDGDFYMKPTGKQSKAPKKKGGVKGVAGTKRGKIVIFPETLESFGLLKMAPPTNVEQVKDTVASLEKKKAEFKVMPRGQILSIAEMNQKFEDDETNRPPRDRDNKKSSAKGGAKKGGKVDTTNAELFPTLGGAPKVAAAAAAEPSV